MSSGLIKPCKTLIWAGPEYSWRSLAMLSLPPGPVFSNHGCGTRFCPSCTTRANVCRCSFNTQNFWVINSWSAAVKYRPVPPTLGVVTNTEGFRESRILRCISVHSSLPITAYMWNISTWSAKYLVNHHCKWRTWPERGQNSTAFCGCAPGSAFSFLTCSERSGSLDSSSSSGSGYFAGSFTSIGRNVSLRHRKNAESTQVLSAHSWYNCQEM